MTTHVVRRGGGVLLVLLLGTTLAAPTPACAAAAAPIAGEQASVAGQFSTKIKRPVTLQVKAGAAWRSIRSARTTSRGQYSFTFRAPAASSTYRVQAKKIKIGRKKYGAKASPTTRVSVVAQRAVLSLPTSAVVDVAMTAKASFSPARTGRQVRLQTLVEADWKDIAVGFQDAGGRTSLRFTPTVTGPHYYRVVALAARGAASITSAHIKVNVTAAPPPKNSHVEWVSQGLDGQIPDGTDATPDISADGRYVVFASSATNYTTKDTGKHAHIYLRDRQTGTTTPVDLTPWGAFGSENAVTPAISADGRFVTYTSASADLASNDSNGKTDVFMWDRESGSTRLISHAASGESANGESQGSTLGNISADGRYVAYISQASNLPGSSTTNWKVYRYDREARTSVMVSVDIGRQQADGDSTNVTMSDDGNRIAFQSTARNLIAPSTAGQVTHVFAANMTLEGRGLTLVSRKKGGPFPNDNSTAPRISGDGAVVSFSSSATDLVAGDTNGQDDAFVAVVGTDEVTLMSSAPNGDPGNDRAYGSAPSADGRYVYFGSQSTNLVPGMALVGWNQVYRFDRTTGTYRLMSINHDGSQARGGSLVYATTSDGAAGAVASSAHSMVPESFNGREHIYLVKAPIG